MQARTLTTQLKPGKTGEAIQIFRDSVVPVAREQKGFKGVLLLTDSTKDTAMVVTLWETEADMKAGETSGYFQEQLAKFAQVLAGPPARDVYEISLLEV